MFEKSYTLRDAELGNFSPVGPTDYEDPAGTADQPSPSAPAGSSGSVRAIPFRSIGYYSAPTAIRRTEGGARKKSAMLSPLNNSAGI